MIAGVSLIFDQAVRVGDNLKVGDTQGIVEDIGLRSTRIRTLDRSLLSVPNGQIANMSLENLSSRDKFWFHPILALRYGTTAPQMHTILDDIHNLLAENRRIEPQTVRVRFLRFGSYSLDVEVFAYVSAGENLDVERIGPESKKTYPNRLGLDTTVLCSRLWMSLRMVCICGAVVP